jgi:hypothetical protein
MTVRLWWPMTRGDADCEHFGRSRRERALHAAHLRLERKRKDEALREYGGIQTCPWCNQWVQLYRGWHFDSKTEPEWDVLHCGNCKGTSYWRFELGMFYAGPRTPPPTPEISDYGRSCGPVPPVSPPEARRNDEGNPAVESRQLSSESSLNNPPPPVKAGKR